MELAVRAGIHAHVHPHVMRHAFGDHVARYAGIKRMPRRRSDIATLARRRSIPERRRWTSSRPRSKGVRFTLEAEQTFYPLETHPASPLEAPTGIEPVYTALQAAA
jgi:hypothetical protein